VYNGCLKCSAKIEADEDDEEVGECTKCKMIQSMDSCKHNISAQVTVKADWTMMTEYLTGT